GFRCDDFPRFVGASDPATPVPLRLDEERAVATLARAHWALGGGAVLVVQPVAAELAVPIGEEEAALHRAESTEVPRGQAATPAMLERVADTTGGASLLANVALLRANAQLAARVAVALRGT